MILQLLDKTEPGCVNWKRVNQPPYKRIGGMMKKMENCQYALDISRTMKFSLVNIGGKDIFDGHKMLTLALIWQIMRAYTLSVLNKLSSGGRRIQDKEIVVWCNETLTQGQKQSYVYSSLQIYNSFLFCYENLMLYDFACTPIGKSRTSGIRAMAHRASSLTWSTASSPAASPARPAGP